MLKLKPKQQTIIETLNNNPEIDELVLIGVVGSGKTVVAAHIAISICYAFPKTQWFVWRRNNSVARKTIVRTFREMLDNMGFIEEVDYTWHDQVLEFRFKKNGSILTFNEADRTKDRDQMKIKGVNSSANLVDEANELEEDTFDMILSRKGRANQHGQPSINMITMNPNNGWAKTRYYDRWKKGLLPPNVAVIEFGVQDSWQSKSDIDALMRKPKWWVERYMKNNWNYADEDHSLITSYLWEKAQIYDIPESEKNAPFNKFIGIDPSDSGGDKTAVTLIENNIVTKQKLIHIPQLEYGLNPSVDDRPLGRLYADEIIKFAQQHGFTARQAKNIAVEENGVGTSIRDNLRTRGWYITVYHATAKRRHESYISIRNDMDNGDLQFLYTDSYDKLDDDPLDQQLFAHSVDVVNGQEQVSKKEDVKKTIGHSPDKADSLAIANWLRRGGDITEQQVKPSNLFF